MSAHQALRRGKFIAVAGSFGTQEVRAVAQRFGDAFRVVVGVRERALVAVDRRVSRSTVDVTFGGG
ncbi:hypothetical protein [Streptomyces sp. NPDC004270]